MTSTLSGTRIAIIGCGLIGLNWAALFRHYGADVILWDPVEAARTDVQTRMAQPLEQLAQLSPCHRPLGVLSVTEHIAEALEGADLIQENAPENLSVKHRLYQQIEALADPQAVLASSTSALTWSELAPGLTNPSCLITAHPFNPPHLVPLVELYGVDQAVLDRATRIYQAADRVPVRLKKDATGHIANRLASALWREAVHIVAEGIADVEDVDAALTHGPGLRWSVMGAHMTYHLGGGAGGIEAYLAHLGPSQERRWATLGDPSLSADVQSALVDGVRRAAAGRDIQTLEAARDAALIAALKARRP